jgi:HD-GYP domain-containing protein (c-di-GMP phosphodiesterase class II)
MKIAGYLHDLGKLAVPNYILEKPSKLTKEEFQIMKQHAYFTYSIIKTIGGLDSIAEWAAFHHEKLDGSGYPFHITENNINIGARIMAVSDVFASLIEDRPYRNKMGTKQIKDVMTINTINKSLDKNVVNILLENLGEISDKVQSEQNAAKEFFRKEFLRVQNKSHEESALSIFGF